MRQSESELPQSLNSQHNYNSLATIHTDPLAHVRKGSVNLYNDQLYEDDLFKMAEKQHGRNLIRKRLCHIFEVGSGLRESRHREGEGFHPWTGEVRIGPRPSYLSEISMLPEWHFINMIEPQEVNQQGFYHVAVVKDGSLLKITIDDYVYYDANSRRIIAHPSLADKPWVHIILKVWAKLNNSYEESCQANPFSFLSTFTYPDWRAFNPCLEKLQTIIKNFSISQQGGYFYVGKTKSDPMVGQFGLVPNCASYIITGYHQEYGNIFVKVRSLVGDKWNGKFTEQEGELPSENITLASDQFIMPMRQFVNVFHLVYVTTNKYQNRTLLFYNKYVINQDARESKCKVIRLQVKGNQHNEEVELNINLHFPNVKAFDLANPRPKIPPDSSQLVTPYCKMLLGRQRQNQNNEGSYADSLRENLLKNEEGYFLSTTNPKYQYIMGSYFHGYADKLTHLLKVKPGRYLFRIKIEKLLPQYRAVINVTSNRQVLLSETKLSQTEHHQFLGEVLSDKARKEERNVIFPNLNRKQSWIIINRDYQSIGYNTILMQVGKNDNRLMTVVVDAQKLKENGYKIKNRTQLNELQQKLTLKECESLILILKEEGAVEEAQKRTWPPEGISVRYHEAGEEEKY